MDFELIMEKLKELERYLKQLELHKDVTVEELTQNLDKVWIVERGLHSFDSNPPGYWKSSFSRRGYRSGTLCRYL